MKRRTPEVTAETTVTAPQGPLYCREELPDRTGFGSACCGKPAKFLVEFSDGSNFYVCGKHAGKYRRHHAVHPLPDHWIPSDGKSVSPGRVRK
jgi:hypothetical protein